MNALILSLLVIDIAKHAEARTSTLIPKWRDTAHVIPEISCYSCGSCCPDLSPPTKVAVQATGQGPDRSLRVRQCMKDYRAQCTTKHAAYMHRYNLRRIFSIMLASVDSSVPGLKCLWTGTQQEMRTVPPLQSLSLRNLPLSQSPIPNTEVSYFLTQVDQ